MIVVWFRFLFRQLWKLVSFRSQHMFPQPAQDSAAIFLNAMLQVSYEEMSHMGKLQVTSTWNVSLQISQIIHRRSRSNKGQRQSRPRSLVVARLCFEHMKVYVAQPSAHEDITTPGDHPRSLNPTATTSKI